MVQIGAHSKRPGPDAEDAQTGGETESPGVAQGGRVGGHRAPEPRAPLSPSGAYLPDAASSEPTRPSSPAGSVFTPSPMKASDESLGLQRGTDPPSPSGSWFTPKTTVPSEPSPLESPVIKAGSVFKLSPSGTSLDPVAPVWRSDSQRRDADQPEGKSGNDDQVDSTRPLMAAAPVDDAASQGDQAARDGGAAEPGAWSASSLGFSATDIAAGLGGAAGGPGGGAGGSGGSGGSGDGRDLPGQPGFGGKPNRRKLMSIVGIAAALVVLVGAGGVYYYSDVSTGTAHAGNKAKVKRKIVTTLARGPEHVLSTNPADGSTGVNGGADIQVVFSEPLSPTSPMPRLHPRIKGAWHVSGDTAVFVPSKGFWQHKKVKLTIPAGATGIQSNGGGLLAAPVKATFTTGSFSEVRLEQDLAQLGYLPLTWAQTTGSPAPLTDLNAQYNAAYSPPAGSYTWQSGYPSRLMNLWRRDAPSQILRGAVAAFQADHGLMLDMITENQYGLVVDGPIGSRLWHAMFKALAHQAMNKHGYTYAVASQHAPETLTVWHNGQVIFHHLANTGIPISPTAVRTDPVYIRLASQIMRGRNPDGSKYHDQVFWVAYFHGGEAVHYFLRYSYGSQQSLGCVELPYNQAKWIWPYLTYGTLVTVTKA